MRVTFNASSLTKALEKSVEMISKKVSEDVLKGVRQRSPVRSGLFKKSWRMSGGKNRYKISNPQPYGHALEHGRSRQAPDGVVGPTIRNIK
jgi:hypothetical protein|tara:strand:- start:7289 stop:7561 length:273 start_codon:yes stop_codon:yes gene_type:complete